MLPPLTDSDNPSTGCNHIDSQACRKRKISVFSLLDDRSALNRISASAEFTFLLLLNTLRRLDRAIIETTKRRWRKNEDQMRGLELAGKKVGLIGFGRIGKRMALYCSAFAAKISYFDPMSDPSNFNQSRWKEYFLRAISCASVVN